MQARAIFEAACDCQKEGIKTIPEVMIPLVGLKAEFDMIAKIIRDTAAKVFEEKGVTVEYMVGTMIELPRAALQAGVIAEDAEFFSFGTNDLTQTTFGLSRDDAGPFLQAYEAKGVIDSDPFVSIDQDGVGELVKIGAERGPCHAPEPETRHLWRTRW